MFRRSIFLAVFAVGCSSESTPPVATDSGQPEDTSRNDATVEDTTDSAPVDSAITDSAIIDSESADSAVPDSATVDADAAEVDAGDPCAAPLACPTATASDKSQLCGRVFDLANTAHVTGTSVAALDVVVYDALDFASNPTASTPIGTLTLDSCGRFSNLVSRPTLGFFALVVDDKAGSADAHVTTAISAAAAAKLDNLRVFATRTTTNAAWSTAAGITSTFAARGAAAFIFLNTAAPSDPFSATPTSSVKVARGGSADATRDFYFSDTGSLERTMIAPAQEVTGANGTALFLDSSSPTAFSGTGGEPVGCTWGSTNAVTTAGVIWVHELRSGC